MRISDEAKGAATMNLIVVGVDHSDEAKAAL
jgi:hypothetical protein